MRTKESLQFHPHTENSIPVQIDWVLFWYRNQRHARSAKFKGMKRNQGVIKKSTGTNHLQFNEGLSGKEHNEEIMDTLKRDYQTEREGGGINKSELQKPKQREKGGSLSQTTRQPKRQGHSNKNAHRKL